MQLYVTNAEIRVQGKRRGGRCFALPELTALLFVFAILTDYGMMRGKERAEGNKRKSFPLFRLNIEIIGKFPLIDTVRKKIKQKRIQLE